MTTYISLLRGINVSGKNLIKMQALKDAFGRKGLLGAITYLQSGNVVFKAKDTDPRSLEIAISHLIKEEFGFDVPVIVLTAEELQRIVSANPFLHADKDPAFLHVTFLSEAPAAYDIGPIMDKARDGEDLSVSGQAVYLYCPHGYGNTKLTNSLLENRLKVRATTRNWKTTCELLKLARTPH